MKSKLLFIVVLIIKILEKLLVKLKRIKSSLLLRTVIINNESDHINHNKDCELGINWKQCPACTEHKRQNGEI